MAWVLLLVAGLLEVGWAIGLKYTEGFTRLWPSVFTLAAMTASVVLLGIAMKSLPVGTSYAVWVGVEVANIHPTRREVTRVRARAIAFRRFVAPQRQALSQLSGAALDWLDDDDRLHLRVTFFERAKSRSSPASALLLTRLT